MANRRYLSESDIERSATDDLEAYARIAGVENVIPASSEKIAFQLLDVVPEWEAFPPDQDQQLGKVRSATFGTPARMFLNLNHVDGLFRSIPFLENTVIGHELGHLRLHIDHSKRFQLALDLGMDFYVATDATSSRSLPPSSESEWLEWQASTYMRHLLVPRKELLRTVRGKRVSGWSDIASLATDFRVTKAVMRIQLEKTKVILRGSVPDYFPAGPNQ